MKRKPIPQSYTSDTGIAYYWHYTPGSKNTPPRAELSIDAPLPFEFRLDHESKPQKIAKWLGFATEFQTGDPAFDGKVYIDSDDPRFCENLSHIQGLRKAVLDLFGHNIKTLSLSGGRLCAEIAKPTMHLSVTDLDRMLDDMVQFKRQMQATASPDQVPFKSMKRQLSQQFKLFFLGSLIAGGAAFIYDGFMQGYTIVPQMQLLAMSLKIWLAAMLGLLILVGIIFHRSSYGCDALGYLFSTGLIGIMLCSYGALYNINIHCDASPARIFTEPVVDRYVTHGRRGSTHYHVSVVDWHGNGTYSMSTGSAIYYAAVPRRTNMRFYTHSGHLGFEWIQLYEVLSK